MSRMKACNCLRKLAQNKQTLRLGTSRTNSYGNKHGMNVPWPYEPSIANLQLLSEDFRRSTPEIHISKTGLATRMGLPVLLTAATGLRLLKLYFQGRHCCVLKYVPATKSLGPWKSRVRVERQRFPRVLGGFMVQP